MTRISHLTAFVVVLALLTAAMLTTTPAGATAQHAAGLVVDTGDRVVTVYVEFSEDTITGEELLRRADVDAVFAEYGSQGTAVCSILGVGSPKDDCFREAEQNGTYWNYSRAEDGDWRRSSRGVASTTVEHGDVDGWAWGPSGSEPPFHSFEEIRRQHAPEPEPSPTPSSPAPPPSEPAPAEAETPSSSPEPSVADEPTTASETETSSGVARSAASETPTETASPSRSSPPPEVRAGDEPSPTPTPTADTILATEETRDRSRGLALILFAAVMIGLVGAIVWRRRTGTAGSHGGR